MNQLPTEAEALSNLFQMDPLNLTKENLQAIAHNLREQRAAFLAAERAKEAKKGEPKAPKPPKGAKKASQADLLDIAKDLD